MYRKKAHLHFVGIGGIGMSGIATILKYQGYTISGCDTDMQQQSISDLKLLGCNIFEGNNTNNCHDTTIDILVYSSAIKPDNPEIIAAQKRGIPIISRALMLAELMRTKYSIAIAGSHGKTTTTSLISHILIEAKKDPTVIIGGHLKNISANARYGNGDFLVAEADESDRSLLSLHATLAIITNIDLEHLETYRDLDDIKNTFKQFINNLPFYGTAILCSDDLNIQSLLPIPHLKIIKYGLDKTHADLYATDINLASDHSSFTIHKKNLSQPLGSITFSMPGEHNIRNALAAVALSHELEIPFNTIAHALQRFGGIDRRFSFKGIYQEAEVYDDYGHHPEEIKNTLLVARKRAKNKLIVVFQPHRYSRTQKLWNSFIDTFTNDSIDHLIMTDIYPASESPIAGITTLNLVAALKKHTKFPISHAPYETDFATIRAQLEPIAQSGDLVLLLGAGKINKLASFLCTSDRKPSSKFLVSNP